MATVGISPFILLSIATLGAVIAWPIYGNYLLVAFIANFGGAVGDLWMMSKLWRFRKCRPLQVVDLKSGIAIDTNDKRAVKIAQMLNAQKSSVRTQFINTWLKIFLGLSIFSFVSIMILSSTNFRGDILIGSKELYFIKYTSNSHEVALTLNFLALVITALIGDVIYLLANSSRQHKAN